LPSLLQALNARSIANQKLAGNQIVVFFTVFTPMKELNVEKTILLP
jgi:hypothetical protein